MKIYLLSNGIDKTIFYQKWYDPNKDYGGKVIEIPDGYEDCIFEDFTNGVLDLDKYNKRIKKENTDELRAMREVECFSIINRGKLWYDNLTEEQLVELNTWYNAWLNVTETRFVPEKPNWIK